MTEHRDSLGQVAIVLHQPQIPENIGAAARAMQNMGLSELIVVAPKHFDLSRIRMMATQAACDVVDRIAVCGDLADALAPFNYVVGTTARLGGQRRPLDPAAMAEKLIPISLDNRVAVLFGREDRGLANEDIRLCHELVHIPTGSFSSLNLAQAVMVVCYELLRATRAAPAEFVPRLASRFELDGMYAGMKDVLVKISYLNPENPDYWMDHLRRFLTRMRIRASEVSMIRGIIRQINWYGEMRYRQGYADGLREREKEEAET